MIICVLVYFDAVDVCFEMLFYDLLVAMFDITPNNFAQESPRAATIVDDVFADNSCAAVSRCVKYFIDEEIRCENLTYLFFCRHCIGGWLFDAVVILATVFAYFDVG